MSHIMTLEIPAINNLDALAVAADELGCELVRGAKSFRYYGGNRAKCDHLIRVNDSDTAYEIGLLARKDGTGYDLQADFYGGGIGLEAAVGQGAAKLRQHYVAELAAADRRRHGYRVRKETVDGRLVIRASK